MKKYHKKKLPKLMIFNQADVATVEVQKGQFTVVTRQITNGGACLELWAVEIVKNGENYPVAIYSDNLSAQIEINRLLKFIDDFRPNQGFQFAEDDSVKSAVELYEELSVAGYF